MDYLSIVSKGEPDFEPFQSSTGTPPPIEYDQFYPVRYHCKASSINEALRMKEQFVRSQLEGEK